MRRSIRSEIEAIGSAPFPGAPFAEPYGEEIPEAVKKAFEEFVVYPSPENAKALDDALPILDKDGFNNGIYHLIFWRTEG